MLPPKKDKAKLYEEYDLVAQAFFQQFGRLPTKAKDNKFECNLWHRFYQGWKSGGITEEQFRSLTSTVQDDVPLSEQVDALMLELEAFKDEHGKYPTSNQPGVPGRELYAKRARQMS